jgi:hypothetical protein
MNKRLEPPFSESTTPNHEREKAGQAIWNSGIYLAGPQSHRFQITRGVDSFRSISVVAATRPFELALYVKIVLRRTPEVSSVFSSLSLSPPCKDNGDSRTFWIDLQGSEPSWYMVVVVVVTKQNGRTTSRGGSSHCHTVRGCDKSVVMVLTHTQKLAFGGGCCHQLST